MCRIRTFPRVHCFSYLFLSSVALWKSYCCLFTGVEERICAREVVFCVYVHDVCLCVRALVYVCVWSSRFVNYIGPNQTCYTHTHMFYSLLNSSLFFFIILYIFYVHTRVYIRLHFSERLLSKRRLRSVSLFIFHHRSKYIHIHIHVYLL